MSTPCLHVGPVNPDGARRCGSRRTRCISEARPVYRPTWLFGQDGPNAILTDERLSLNSRARFYLGSAPARWYWRTRAHLTADHRVPNSMEAASASPLASQMFLHSRPKQRAGVRRSQAPTRDRRGLAHRLDQLVDRGPLHRGRLDREAMHAQVGVAAGRVPVGLPRRRDRDLERAERGGALVAGRFSRSSSSAAPGPSSPSSHPYQPFAAWTARRWLVGECPPTTIGGCVSWTGRGRSMTLANETKRPANDGTGSSRARASRPRTRRCGRRGPPADAERLELRREVADADADHEPSAREHVDPRELLREQDRLALRQHDHADGEPHGARQRREVAS